MNILERLTNDVTNISTGHEKIVIINLTDYEVKYMLWQDSKTLSLVIEEIKEDC